MSGLGQGAIIGGKYRLQRELARGGMGAVWRATHLHLDAPVAIKFMDAALGGSRVAEERFLREAKAAAQIQSPHVVHISDYGVEAGSVPYIVMELLQGEDLDQRLLRGALGLVATEQLVVQAARGLRRAHEAGIVHRDLKPSNLFLAGDGGEDWTVKIVDFGVAKARGHADLPAEPQASRAPSAAAGGFTQTGIVLGSPQYMSPEQARGFSHVDQTADVWALATIAFRALTGRRRFEGMDPTTVLTRLVYDPLPPPSSAAPELPEPLAAFFDRALHDDPTRRFPTVRDLSHAFVRAADEVRRRAADTPSISGAILPAVPPGPGPPQTTEPNASGDPAPGLAPVPPQGPVGRRTLPMVAIALAAALLLVMTVGAVTISGSQDRATATGPVPPRKGLVPMTRLESLRADLEGEMDDSSRGRAEGGASSPTPAGEVAGPSSTPAIEPAAPTTAADDASERPPPRIGPPTQRTPGPRGPRRSWGF